MSKFEKYATLFIVACVMVLVTGVCCKISHRRGYSSGWRDAIASAKSDTLLLVDTIRIDHPVPEYVYIDREKPVYLPVHDTALVVIRDTTYIAVEREIRGYSGEDYRLQVSGVAPALDWIEVFAKQTTITNTIPDVRRWTFGISAGPGLVYDFHGIHAGLGIVAGVQYRF